MSKAVADEVVDALILEYRKGLDAELGKLVDEQTKDNGPRGPYEDEDEGRGLEGRLVEAWQDGVLEGLRRARALVRPTPAERMPASWASEPVLSEETQRRMASPCTCKVIKEGTPSNPGVRAWNESCPRHGRPPRDPEPKP